jgi:threonine dehydrogenase-like Zn-dependent dehydrogenase
LAGVWTAASLPDLAYDAVIEASTSAELPAAAVEFVEPGGRVVYVGLAGQPSLVDTRQLALKDVTAVGVLSASPGLAATIKAYASGSVDPRPLVAGTVGLDDVPGVLSGYRSAGISGAPKIQVDPAA